MKRMICLILLALGLQNTHVLALTPDEVDARMRAMVQGNIDNPWPGISDPDGDGVLNAIEAFFGSHPGEVSSGLIALNVTSEEISFTHPQSDQPPADLQLSYSWSCNLADWYDCDGANGPASGETVSVSSETVDGTATVTVTPSAEMGCLFLRAKVQEK